MTLSQAMGRTDLSLRARLLLPVLVRLAKGHRRCLSGNKSLAQALGCAQRTIQVALHALQSSKLIEIVRDYGLRTRRCIRLLFLDAPATPPSPNSLAQEPAPSCAGTCAHGRPSP